MKMKKGDTIIVTSGKDKGKKGKIEKVLSQGNHVLVANVNMYKRHAKKRDEKHPGGIIDFPRALPVGNVALFCSSCGKPTRAGFLMTKGEKLRICRKCNQKL